MADSNFDNRRSHNSSGKNESIFSWSDEHKAFAQRNSVHKGSSNNTYRNNGSQDTIFSGYNPESGRSDPWTASAKGQGYHYEYPGEDYKYTPRASYESYETGNANASESIYSSFAASSQPKKAAVERNKSQHSSLNTKERKRQPAPGAPGKASKQGRKASASAASKKMQAEAPDKKKAKKARNNADRAALKNEAQRRNAPAPEQRRSAPRPEKAKKPKAEMSKPAKKRALKKANKERIKIDKRNKRIKTLQRKGFSQDEIRSILQREQMRSRALHTLVIVVCVLAAVFTAVGAAGVVYGLPIAEIKVKGSKIYKAEEIIAAGEIAQGDNMLLITQKKLSEKISVALPYVEFVEIKHNLPDTLTLTVKETSDKLLFATSKGYICTDKNGKITSEKKQTAKNGKIKIEGFEPQEYEVGRMFVPNEENGNAKKYVLVKQIVEALEKAKIANCTLINVDNSGLIVLGCGKFMKIYLDSETDFEYKFSMLAEQLKTNNRNPSGSYYYDLRFSGQIVYKEGELK